MTAPQPCVVCGKPAVLGVVCIRRKCVEAYQDYLENGEMEKVRK